MQSVSIFVSALFSPVIPLSYQNNTGLPKLKVKPLHYVKVQRFVEHFANNNDEHCHLLRCLLDWSLLVSLDHLVNVQVG